MRNPYAKKKKPVAAPAPVHQQKRPADVGARNGKMVSPGTTTMKTTTTTTTTTAKSATLPSSSSSSSSFSNKTNKSARPLPLRTSTTNNNRDTRGSSPPASQTMTTTTVTPSSQSQPPRGPLPVPKGSNTSSSSTSKSGTSLPTNLVVVTKKLPAKLSLKAQLKKDILELQRQKKRRAEQLEQEQRQKLADKQRRRELRRQLKQQQQQQAQLEQQQQQQQAQLEQQQREQQQQQQAQLQRQAQPDKVQPQIQAQPQQAQQAQQQAQQTQQQEQEAQPQPTQAPPQVSQPPQKKEGLPPPAVSASAPTPTSRIPPSTVMAAPVAVSCRPIPLNETPLSPPNMMDDVDSSSSAAAAALLAAAAAALQELAAGPCSPPPPPLTSSLLSSCADATHTTTPTLAAAVAVPPHSSVTTRTATTATTITTNNPTTAPSATLLLQLQQQQPALVAPQLPSNALNSSSTPPTTERAVPTFVSPMPVARTNVTTTSSNSIPTATTLPLMATSMATPTTTTMAPPAASFLGGTWSRATPDAPPTTAPTTAQLFPSTVSSSTASQEVPTAATTVSSCPSTSTTWNPTPPTPAPMVTTTTTNSSTSTTTSLQTGCVPLPSLVPSQEHLRVLQEQQVISPLPPTPAVSTTVGSPQQPRSTLTLTHPTLVPKQQQQQQAPQILSQPLPSVASSMVAAPQPLHGSSPPPLTPNATYAIDDRIQRSPTPASANWASWYGYSHPVPPRTTPGTTNWPYHHAPPSQQHYHHHHHHGVTNTPTNPWVLSSHTLPTASWWGYHATPSPYYSTAPLSSPASAAYHHPHHHSSVMGSSPYPSPTSSRLLHTALAAAASHEPMTITSTLSSSSLPSSGAPVPSTTVSWPPAPSPARSVATLTAATVIGTATTSAATPTPPKPAPRRMTPQEQQTHWLAHNVLTPPSPFATTYRAVVEPFVLIKRVPTAEKPTSFGINIRVLVDSALVEPEELPSTSKTLLSTTSSVSANASTTSVGPPKQQQEQQPVAVTENNPAPSQSMDAASTEPPSAPQRLPPTLLWSTTTEKPGAPPLPVPSVATQPQVTPSSAAVAPAPLVVAKPRRRRRRRRFFAALTVVDPTIQNQLRQEEEAPADIKSTQEGDNCQVLLQPGDIFLSINGKSTAGLTFAEACTLFQSSPTNNSSSTDGWIRCVVHVARKIPKPVPVPRPIKTDGATQLAKRTNLAPTATVERVHLWMWCRHKLDTLLDPKNIPGKVEPIDTALKGLLTTNPAFAGLKTDDFYRSWQTTTDTLYRVSRQRALTAWKEAWAKELSEVRETASRTYFSDAQRSTLRAAPRPIQGCKCGSTEHRYVNDPKCPLYSNLRALDDRQGDELDEEGNSKAAKKKTNLPRDLNSVQAAVVGRALKDLAERKAEDAEARFVTRMEDVQLRVCRKAVHAPSLAVMLLSAVADLADQFQHVKPLPELDLSSNVDNQKSPEKTTAATLVSDVNDDDESELDIPLAELAKRKLESDPRRNSKRKKTLPKLSKTYLITLARHISHVWGHVAREPSHADYLWRWEVYHGQNESSSSWEANARNPRRPHALSLETLHTLVDESIIENLDDASEPSTEGQQAALMCLAYALDQSRNGLMDEVMAAVRSGVLQVNEGGILTFARHWYLHVDILVLDEMEHAWGSFKDPYGRHRVNSYVLETLEREWIKTKEGWAGSCDPGTTIYDTEQFESWREALQDMEESRTNDTNGIGKFGI